MLSLKINFGSNRTQEVPGICPAPDTPVSWKSDDSPNSVFGDKVWIFPGQRPGSICRIKWFSKTGDIENDLATANVSQAKQLLLLRMTHGTVISVSSLKNYIKSLGSLLRFCSEKKIFVSHLPRYGLAVKDFYNGCSNTTRDNFLALARCAISNKDALGWIWLSHDQIEELRKTKSVEHRQTAVIPLRILSEVLATADSIIGGYLNVKADFLSASQISLGNSLSDKQNAKLEKWSGVVQSFPALHAELSRLKISPSARRSVYIDIIRTAAFVALARGSFARKQEVLSLRRGCWAEYFVDGKISYCIQGETTKTQDNSNALWVVPRRAKDAVDALESILDWYYTVHPQPPKKSDLLFQIFDMNLGVRNAASQARSGKLLYGETRGNMSLLPLLPLAKTIATSDDIAEARMFTTSLDNGKFVVGCHWPLAPHQLRRTLIIHASASGLVSNDSIVFQSKHDSNVMSSYYAKNYWRYAVVIGDNPVVVATDSSLAEEFTASYSDSYNRDRATITSDDRFFSYYGTEHKRRVLSEIPMLSLAEIKSGISNEVLKRNTLGICAQSDFCEFQSALTVRGCMTKADGMPCPKSIVDTGRVSELQALVEDLSFRLSELRAGDTFEREQVQADISSTQNAIELMQAKRNVSHGS